ncbi:MAG: agmatine/peptidylarginine deiminase, partial [Myxococcota bacterium]
MSRSVSATEPPESATASLGPPADRGFRWPAEWEPHEATWLAWPHNPETWPGCLDRAVDEFAGLVRVLHGRETVRILVDDEAMEESARRRLGAAGIDVDRGVGFPHVQTNDAWLRDSGPITLVRDADGQRQRLAVDFRFDSWGGKYPPWSLDAAVPRRVAKRQGVELADAGFVLEGGSVDGNGCGAVLTTESCLLHPNREAGRSRELMERRLREWLGVTHVLWLSAGLAGDDTDGHVDDVARFVAPRTVVAAVADPGDTANEAPLSENRRRLRDLRDQDGAPLTVIDLPVPPPRSVAGARCPASYANFYLANGVALVPTFSALSDERALSIFREV